ncbi:MAG: DUF4301 family protein [Dysgonamonadaceae bacterium]|jgi:hypothetical protein|nr:DUF4301 family protein [Dysgonamonadaceae bacterium]
MFTPEDLSLLKEKQISLLQIETQLKDLKNGFPFLRIVEAASVKKGILRVPENDEKKYLDAWDSYRNGNRKITKFVPASGAASRMFKDLFSFADADYELPKTSFEKQFFAEIEKFAFYDELNKTCVKLYGKDIPSLTDANQYKPIAKALLSTEGLNYGNLPKGLLLFHRYPDGNRTPVEEHLTEGALYAADNNGKVNIHFTVSPEHLPLFKQLVADRKEAREKKLNAVFDISYSVQKPNTDTIAADMDHQPFRNDDGSLLFRPGGHGALIENLNDIDSDVIFIKNIDNVVPDRLKAEESHFKKLIAGVLVSLQQRACDYVEKLISGKYTPDDLNEIRTFLENELVIVPNRPAANDKELASFLLKKLDRPFRVCGMVKNVGEPGGGPFIAENPDGTASLQILESSQIDTKNEKAIAAFKNGSHFNPVDLVCGVKNYKGEKYDLTKYVDKNTGFISQKSKGGKELKALELPGLWNGAMSGWNTVFVEVPISTFNPVKTVNDLLRAEHQ